MKKLLIVLLAIFLVISPKLILADEDGGGSDASEDYSDNVNDNQPDDQPQDVQPNSATAVPDEKGKSRDKDDDKADLSDKAAPEDEVVEADTKDTAGQNTDDDKAVV